MTCGTAMACVLTGLRAFSSPICTMLSKDGKVISCLYRNLKYILFMYVFSACKCTWTHPTTVQVQGSEETFQESVFFFLCVYLRDRA